MPGFEAGIKVPADAEGDGDDDAEGEGDDEKTKKTCGLDKYSAEFSAFLKEHYPGMYDNSYWVFRDCRSIFNAGAAV